MFVAKHNYTNYAFRLPPSSIPASLSLPLPPSLTLSSLPSLPSPPSSYPLGFPLWFPGSAPASSHCWKPTSCLSAVFFFTCPLLHLSGRTHTKIEVLVNILNFTQCVMAYSAKDIGLTKRMFHFRKSSV